MRPRDTETFVFTASIPVIRVTPGFLIIIVDQAPTSSPRETADASTSLAPPSASAANVLPSPARPIHAELTDGFEPISSSSRFEPTINIEGEQRPTGNLVFDTLPTSPEPTSSEFAATSTDVMAIDKRIVSRFFANLSASDFEFANGETLTKAHGAADAGAHDAVAALLEEPDLDELLTEVEATEKYSNTDYIFRRDELDAVLQMIDLEELLAELGEASAGDETNSLAKETPLDSHASPDHPAIHRDRSFLLLHDIAMQVQVVNQATVLQAVTDPSNETVGGMIDVGKFNRGTTSLGTEAHAILAGVEQIPLLNADRHGAHFQVLELVTPAGSHAAEDVEVVRLEEFSPRAERPVRESSEQSTPASDSAAT